MIRVVLAGYGQMGRRYAAQIAASSSLELAGVVVGTEAGAARAAAELGMPVGTDWEATLDRAQPDAVIVASPTPAHAEQVEAAMTRAIPCLVEKPVTDTVAACVALVARQRSSGAHVMVGHTLVYTPSFLRLLALLGSGRVGVLREVEMRATIRVGAGWQSSEGGYWQREFLLNLLLHRVALFNRLLGAEPERVRVARFDPTPGEEAFDADLWYSGRGRQRLLVRFGQGPGRTEARVVTSRGVFTWGAGDGGETLAFAPEGQAERAVPFPAGEALARQVEAFADAVGRAREPYEGLDQGLSALRATESLVQGLLDDPGRADLRALAQVEARGSVLATGDEAIGEAAGFRVKPGMTDEPGWRAFAEPDDVPARWPDPEEVAFGLGFKPVLYRTLPAGEEAALRARFPAAHVEVVAYELHHDAIQDRRLRGQGGEAHVDCFLSADPDLARRAAAIYREGRVGASILEMGALLGYPACCVRAFADLPERTNNSFLRHATWRATAAVGHAFDAHLANCHLVATPFYPCSYGCAAGLEQSRGVFAALPERAAFLAYLGRPVLYLDDTRQVILEGDGDTREVCYSRVSVPAPRTEARERALDLFVAEVVRPLSEGDRVVAHRGQIEIFSAGKQSATLRAPLLRLFPFRVP